MIRHCSLWTFPLPYPPGCVSESLLVIYDPRSSHLPQFGLGLMWVSFGRPRCFRYALSCEMVVLLCAISVLCLVTCVITPRPRPWPRPWPSPSECPLIRLFIYLETGSYLLLLLATVSWEALCLASPTAFLFPAWPITTHLNPIRQVECQGGQMAERLENRAINQKVASSIFFFCN